ncbi:hypothetical protein BGZ61DRAFT_432345 [Ilyonectria robusta]|uniref:uncharacterized protein n=1 Tax=Ilyonectria robusta TaxID=1079257 RepID=UPI001E8D17EE|nr:uncharacterized protein BGZ61DRAFT_432345 [Ilyonectria robusta]KAH8662778.1 hypothetical protein BGZ61DRAFT_432345 [Ilyonectria robusta]
MISVELCKPTDDNERSNRQSLPSISEFISGTKPSSSHLTPSSSMQSDSSLPSPFAPAPRPYPEIEKHSSPQPLFLAWPFSPRQDARAASDSPSPPFSSLASLRPASDRRPSPSKPDFPPPHYDTEPQKPPQLLHPFKEVHAHPPPPLPALVSYQSDHLPPGQMPLPAYPISPQHAIPPNAPRPCDPGPVPDADEEDHSVRARNNATVEGHFDSWIYEDWLSRLGTSSRTILNFAEAYSGIAREEHGAHLIPERLPTEREVSDMLGSIEPIKHWLKQVRDLVQVSIQNQKAGGRGEIKGLCEEEHDVLMSGDGMMPQHDSIKKRRRVNFTELAPSPGRCHSCDRIDTPEWRRGPDGAKTLCNACGLQYAKLERKRQLEVRLIRPKSEGLRT